jgi:uncharacterized coiled-coil protein SlyX
MSQKLSKALANVEKEIEKHIENIENLIERLNKESDELWENGQYERVVEVEEQIERLQDQLARLYNC